MIEAAAYLRGLRTGAELTGYLVIIGAVIVLWVDRSRRNWSTPEQAQWFEPVLYGHTTTASCERLDQR